MKEEALAAAVVTELQRQGFETYEEVSMGYASRRADIVAVRGPILMVVECKARMSLKLLDQLYRWQGQAHYLVGAFGFSRVGPAAKEYAKAIGAGLWVVGASEIHIDIDARLHRTANIRRLRANLHPKQRSADYAKAGSQGGYFTPFRGTCDALLEVVKRTPGIELREALSRIAHHYASSRSAMSSLPGLIRGGHVPGIVVDDGAPLKLYLANAPKPAPPLLDGV